LRASAGLGAAVALGGLPSAPPRAEPRGPNEADFVFRNGPIFTSRESQPWAKAVAVRDGFATMGVEPRPDTP